MSYAEICNDCANVGLCAVTVQDQTVIKGIGVVRCIRYEGDARDTLHRLMTKQEETAFFRHHKTSKPKSMPAVLESVPHEPSVNDCQVLVPICQECTRKDTKVCDSATITDFNGTIVRCTQYHGVNITERRKLLDNMPVRKYKHFNDNAYGSADPSITTSDLVHRRTPEPKGKNADAHKKPPLGLIPKEMAIWNFHRQRVGEIIDAIARYSLENKVVPIEWIEELGESLSFLNS